MKLIADSGSTKTNWYLFADSSNVKTTCQTTGINPFFQQSSEIVKTLRDEFSLPVEGISEIYFYGAGAANQMKKEELYKALWAFFGIENIFAESDLLAAARSLCGTSKGIAAIMGTGSNSGLYDGKNIVHNVSPLGYILGDEGSGAVLGKKLLSDILKNQLPAQIIEKFYEHYKLAPAEIMENIYRKPFPNRYMAKFTPFMLEHIHEPSVNELAMTTFRDFFLRNIAQYPGAEKMQVHFTGSIAFYFADLIREAAHSTGFEVGQIVQDPLKGLIEYHTYN